MHLLDQLVRQLPEGIYLRSVKQVDRKVTIVGYAQSNARVSTLMRNIEGSPWLEKPELVEIKLVPCRPRRKVEPQRMNEFTLNFEDPARARRRRRIAGAGQRPRSRAAKGGKA